MADHFLKVGLAALLLSGCGARHGAAAGSAVTVKLPPARLDSTAPGFSFAAIKARPDPRQ